MYKTLLLSLVLILFLLVPLGQVDANEVDEYGALAAQVEALSTYIERNFVSHENTTLSHEQLRAIVSDGAQWLKNSQEENGHFAYEYVPYDDVYFDDDHIVRQAGALYELGEIARHDPENTLDVSDTIESALLYFSERSIEMQEGDEIFTCIVSTPASSKCRLGSASLALLGLLGYVEKNDTAAAKHKELIEGYIAYIMAMKKEEGGFRDMVYEDNKSPEKESSFSNGEALLALVRYYQYSPREDVKQMIDGTFKYLSEKEDFETPLYLWIMAALKDMQVLWPSEEYVSYAKVFTETRRGALTRVHYTDKNYCATTEGLASAYSILEGNVSDWELQILKKEIDFWNTHNSVLQILPVDVYRLVQSDGVFSMQILPDLMQAQGGFLTSASVLTQRIDYTQHCISAYLQTLVDIEGGEL